LPPTRREHGFTRVDAEPRPEAFVECLDRIHEEPFFREYKRRVRELLQPRPNGLYLDVGMGTGADARELQAKVIGVDRSLTMCREARRRGAPLSLVADAEALPLRSGSMDGCWSDRTFQHLANPRKALAELVRVMKPGATIVVVDADYGTQTMEFPDQALAGKVFDFRARHMRRNGTLAHEMANHFESAGLADASAEKKDLVVRDPTSVDNVMGLRSWARTAQTQGAMDDDEVRRWESLYDDVVASGRFRWSVSFFLTSGRKK
jgi:ubiquinone/menaquinone biosynthesis C-methylase UbiE